MSLLYIVPNPAMILSAVMVQWHRPLVEPHFIMMLIEIAGLLILSAIQPFIVEQMAIAEWLRRLEIQLFIITRMEEQVWQTL